MTAHEIQQEALSRARNGEALSNYPDIFHGFMDKGIAEGEIRPRENVFTYQAWRALGRQVKRGEHGVKVMTVRVFTRQVKDESGNDVEESYSVPWSATVFHISQTEGV